METHTHTTIDSNVHDTDQHHTSDMHAHTHTDYDCSRNWVLTLSWGENTVRRGRFSVWL